MKSILAQFPLEGPQEQAARSPNPAIAVTAGAGSGKTRTLVGRYLRLLEDGCPIRALIAITFTDKAAREMRSRIRAEIEKLLAKPDSSLPVGEGLGVGADWHTLFAELDSARIGTIHSLCAEILRAHPAEAGIDPNFGVLEEGLAAAFKAQAVKAALIWAANHPQAVELFGIFKEGELRRVLATLLNRRLDLPAREEHPTPLSGWSQAIEVWFAAQFAAPEWSESLEDLAAFQSSQPTDKLELARQEVLTAWEAARAALFRREFDTLTQKLAELRKAISTGGQKGNWAAADLEAVREDMRALRDFYEAELKPLIGGAPPKVSWALDEQAAAALPALDLLVTQVLREYQALKDEQQALDFDDLEGQAAQLLTENASVRARWQAGIRAVLVDEFQDTNDRQRQIVYALAAFQPSNLPNSPETPEISSGLFIVGDAKQSIYKFRGADVTVFRQVQADITAAGGLPLDLDLTFRTHKPLLETLNALLAPVMGASADLTRPYQVPFAPLRAYRQEPKSATVAPPYVEFILGLGEDADSGRSAAAGALTERLHHIHAREGFEWGEMALLFRASTAFAAYENALETAGIPFVTVAGRGFYDRPEIRDLLNALAAIADPTDDLALAGLLRSPALGLGDAAIYRLRYPHLQPITQREMEVSWGEREVVPPENEKPIPQPIWETLKANAENVEAPTEQLRALNIITDLHARVGRASAAEVLKRYLDLTGYRTMLGGVQGGGRLQRNVDKLLADAHRSRLVNLDDFLAYVQTLRDVGSREGEAPVEAEGAVQLMTVHKAKGLEFPLVVIADAAYSPPTWSDPVLLDESLGLLVGLQDPEGARSLAYKLGTLTEAARSEAEDKRLLYVAATRTREKLLVNGYVKRLKAGNLSLSGWLGSLGAVIGLDEITLEGEFSAPQELEVLLSGVNCTLSPLTPDRLTPGFPLTPARSPAGKGEISEGRALPDLAAPLQIPEMRLLDEKILAREADPPRRVWRVVPKSKRPSGPAWVVGTLVHEAIRHWRFPGEDFEAFITPFALESGLTDRGEIAATIQAAARLLTRFREHPLWAEIEASERYHEVPYTLPGDRGIIDLLYRSGDGWVVVDFKTDELRSEAEVGAAIEREGYTGQVRRYAEAVAGQWGARPKLLLVFLQVGRDKIVVVEV